MICVVALIVFGILSIFSTKYRNIAKEALGCTFRRITLRKCNSSLNVRLKAEITGKFMKLWPPAGRFLYKSFEIFSWIFLILTILTLFFLAKGIYLFAVYGNCNGPDSNQFCIFDPLGTSKANINEGTTEGNICVIPGHEMNNLTTPNLISYDNLIIRGDINSKIVVIEFGCYSCHFTGKVEKTVQRIIDNYDDKIVYIYMDFPLTETHPNALNASQAAYCAKEQDKYWEYRKVLFSNQDEQSGEELLNYADKLDLNITQFESCIDAGRYISIIEQNYATGLASGISVTPTFFINDKTLIGAKEYKDFKKIIEEEITQ